MCIRDSICADIDEAYLDVATLRKTISGIADGLGLAMGASCLLYTSPSPRDRTRSRMPSSA